MTPSLIFLFTITGTPFATSASLLEQIIKVPFTDIKCPLVFQCVSASLVTQMLWTSFSTVYSFPSSLRPLKFQVQSLMETGGPFFLTFLVVPVSYFPLRARYAALPWTVVNFKHTDLDTQRRSPARSHGI
jgi:hypothetical protein